MSRTGMGPFQFWALSLAPGACPGKAKIDCSKLIVSGVLTVACILSGARAYAEPAVVASGAYPEGLLWHGGRMLFTEMGADRVSIIEHTGAREFWRDAGCGPTSIAPFGSSGFLVNCHLGRHVVEVSIEGVTGRRFPWPCPTPIRRPRIPAPSAPEFSSGCR